MKEFKGTKGEWLIEFNSDQPNYVTNKEGNKAIAFIPHLHPQSKENIQLIAAAPELLEALQSTLDLIKSTWLQNGWDYSDYNEVKQAEKAINKALGV